MSRTHRGQSIWTPGGASGGLPANAAPGVQVKCPRCQMPFAAPVVNVLDVRQHPHLKAALLSGYLNRAKCPGCGAVSALNVPLVYHDPEKELLLILLPSEMGLPADQQQRLIGGLVQAVMSSVPSAQRKGYFLRPQTILSLQRLVEVILEADGVTREMLEAQDQRLRLLEELLGASADPARLASLIEERRKQVDYTFFATLTATAQEAQLAGDTQGAQRLQELRDRLLQDPALAVRLPQPFAPGTTLEAALDRLLPLLDDEEALSAMVVLNRPTFDYLFFVGLTQRLEQAQVAGDAGCAARLTSLRRHLLEEIERQDKALQAAQQEDQRLLEEILSSPDQQAAVRQHLGRIDTLFLNALGTAIQRARQEGKIERSARLDNLRRSILSLLAESMPPELRLVNHLLSAEKPEDRQALLAESSELLSDDLQHLVEDLIAEVQEQGRMPAAHRLQAILAEVQQARAAGPAAGALR